MLLKTALVGLVAVSLTDGCGGGETAKVQDDTTEVAQMAESADTGLDGSWVVSEIYASDPPPEGGISLTVERGYVVGTSTCNTYSAPIYIDGTGVRVDPIQSGRKVCGKAEMKTEAAFFHALKRVERYDIAKDGTLTFYTLDTVMLRATPADAG